MALGDTDMAAEVFFQDWNTATFGGNSAGCILDAPGKDFPLTPGSVSNFEPAITLSATAFAPMPKAKDAIEVDGVSYAVLSSSPVGDGATVELRLRLA